MKSTFKKCIKGMLDNGKTEDEIMEAFTEAMNSLTDERKKAAERKADSEKILSDITKFYAKYYPDIKFELRDFKNSDILYQNVLDIWSDLLGF